MPITINHSLTATTPDDLAYEIRPTHWNSRHVATIALAGSEVSPVFSNSPTVSFGLSGTAVTASAVGGGAVSFSAGTSSRSLNSVVFSNSNGVSFGLNGSTITGSIAAYLTTAMQSQSSSVFAKTGFTSASTAGSDIVGTLNTDGLNVGIPAYLTTAMQSASSSVFAKTGFTSATTAGTAVVGTLNTNGLSVGVPAFITTAMASNAVTLSNIKVSAGTQSSNLSAITFADGSGVSFGLDAGTITASVNAAGGGLTNINVSAGTTSNNLSALTFANGSGVSFGLNGSVVTASVAPPQAGSINISAGTTSNTFTAITFSNSNNVSFGLNGSTLTASIANYLTTAMQSQSSSVFAKTGFSSTTTAGTAIVATHDTNGLSMGVPAFLTTAMQSQSSSVFAKTGFSSTTTAGTAIVGTHNTDGLSLGVPAFITTAMASNAATISNIKVSAGTSSTNLSAVTFSNSNGVSFGLNGSVITGSINAGASVNFSAGTTSQNLGSVVFSNGSGVTFGLNSNTITASVDATSSVVAGANITISTAGSTITIIGGAGAANAVFSAGTSSASLGSIVFSNSNNVSFGLNGSTVTGSIANYLTTAMQSASSSVFAKTGFTSATTAGTAIVATHNTDGLSMGVPAFITTAMLSNAATISNIKISAGTTSNNLSALTFSDLNGVSFGLNGSVVTASVSPSGANPVFSAGANSASLGSVVFSNSNGVSFGLNGSTITGSVSPGAFTGSWYALGNTTNNSSSSLASYSLNGLGGMTVGYSNGSIQLSVPASSSLVAGANITISTAGSTITVIGGAGAANPVFSAGANSASLGSIVFSNSNGVSFGLNGSTITASAVGGGAGTGFTTTATAGTAVVGTHDSNGLKLGVPPFITTFAAQTTQSAAGAIGVSNTGNTAGNVGYSTGISYALAASGLLTLSQSTAAGAATAYIQHPAWLTTAAVSTAGLYAVGNTTSASSTTHDPRTLSINALGAMTAGFNAGSLILSAPASSIITGAGGISVSSNGSTISALLATTNYEMFPADQHWTMITAPGNGSMSIQFLQARRRVSATRLDVLFNWSAASSATTNTGAIALTAYAGIYTQNGSTLSSLSGGSTQTTYTYASNTAGTGNSGTVIRPISVPLNIDMLPGNYFVAFGWSSNSSSIGASTTNYGQTQSVLGPGGLLLSGTNYAEWGNSTASSRNWFGGSGGLGVYSVATASSLTGISMTGINMTGAAFAAANIGIILRG